MKIKIGVFFIVPILIEIILRLGFSIVWQTPFLRPHEVIYQYYPMVKTIKEKHATTNASTYKVLVLSCSTLHQEWGDFNELLTHKLNVCEIGEKSSSTDSFVVFTAAGIGFSSADNLNCYQLLSDLKFDMVVCYGGINDARFNNCPSTIFKENYSHIKWNNEINCILRHSEINFMVLPFFLDYTCQLIIERYCQEDFIPNFYSMRRNWWQYGSNFKSLKVFEKNIESIKKLSTKKHEELLLLSYCYYLPKDYTLEKFRNKKLDYVFQQNSRETEIWGEPSNVTLFLDSSNIALKALSDSNHYFLDIQERMLSNNTYFADICHFSKKGLSVFCNNLSEEIKGIKQKPKRNDGY